MYLGFEPTPAGCMEQTNPLSYGSHPNVKHLSLFIHPNSYPKVLNNVTNFVSKSHPTERARSRSWAWRCWPSSWARRSRTLRAGTSAEGRRRSPPCTRSWGPEGSGSGAGILTVAPGDLKFMIVDFINKIVFKICPSWVAFSVIVGGL